MLSLLLLPLLPLLLLGFILYATLCGGVVVGLAWLLA
jgi:hypothetical protein